MEISSQTKTAFDVLTKLKAEWPGRFDIEIDSARKGATQLISDDKEWEAEEVLWQLINGIDREVSPECLGEAKRVVASARSLRSYGLKGLQFMLAEAKEAFGRGDYAVCVRKCLRTIHLGEQANERTRSRMSREMIQQARMLGF